MTPGRLLSRGFALLAGLGGLTLSSGALADEPNLVELPVDVNVEFPIPAVPANAATLFEGIFFRTPAGTSRFSFEVFDPSTIAGVTAADNNVDLFMRADGPFTDLRNPDDSLAVDRLVAQADYYAASLTNDDLVSVEPFQGNRIRARDWHVVLLAGEGSGGSVGLRASITRAGAGAAGPTPAVAAPDFIAPDCEIGPWADQTPFAAEGGNSATTLGGARRAAFEHATQRLFEQLGLTSPRPVRIRACWESAGGDANSAQVARAAPASGLLLFPNSPAPGTVYAQSVVERFAGTDACALPVPVCEDGLCGLAQVVPDCSAPDIDIFFNVDVDGPEALGDSGFYYGLDPGDREPGEVDFVSIVMHELVHGLGFTTALGADGSVAEDGSGKEVNDAFLAQLVEVQDAGPRPLFLATPEERAAAIQSGDGLAWRGPESATSLLNDLVTVDEGLIRMYAPPEFEPLSSVTHVDLVYCDLMLPRNREGCDETLRDAGLATLMLRELGWYEGPNVPPYLGLMLDPARMGHGFEFQLVTIDGQGRPVYVVTLYSYASGDGSPEWYQAVGFVENGVFYGEPTLNAGDGLQEYDYEASRTPPQRAVAGHRGQLVLSFNAPADSPACNDGLDRGSPELLVAMQWRIDDTADEWCVQPLVAVDDRPDEDFGGLWFSDVADQGWGMSIENAGGTLFVLLYVYAADGSPVWFFAQADGFTPGEPLTMTLSQRDGYDRLETFGELVDRDAGTMTILLSDPSGAGDGSNRVTIDVDYLGPEGGGWDRDDVAIQRLSAAR